MEMISVRDILEECVEWNLCTSDEKLTSVK